MNTLSERERDGLDDVFLSISSRRFSSLKWLLSEYHCYWVLNIKESFLRFRYNYISAKKNKNTLKLSISQKNCPKVEKHR
jgi:hypothetical protein